MIRLFNIILKLAVLFGMAMFLTLSCQRSSLPAVEPEEVFTETQVSFIPKGVEDGAATKAEVVSSLDATGFYASAVTGTPGADVAAWTNVQFTKIGDDFVGGKYWPASNPSFRFFGSNAPLTYTATGATVSASNTTDIVCAYKDSPVYGARNTLQFDHIYARVGAVTVSATAPYTVSDVTIYLVDAKTGGTYNLYTGAGHSDGTGWSNLTPSVATDLQIYRNAGSIVSGNSGTGTSPDLYVVPGEYELKASWTASVGDYSEGYETMSSTSTVSIQGGKVNTISCSLAGDASEVRFSVGVEAWGTRNISIDPSELNNLPGD